jgi:hypothetical protein
MKRALSITVLTLATAAALAAAPPKTADAPRFLVLVKGGDRGARTPEQQRAVVAEYVAWAHSLRDSGHLVAADELANEGTCLASKSGAGAPCASAAGGFFLITAKDAAEALALSRDCPSLAHGGSVEVTPIVGN